MKGRTLVLAAVCIATSACYHQVVQTGRAPGATVVQKSWTPTWILGLVPATVDVTQQCTSGVATVETQRSVANSIVGFLTLGIFTPVSTKVTCASGSALAPGMPEFYVGRGTSLQDRERVFGEAVETASRIHGPVALRF